MAELVDALVLGTSGETRGSSTLSIRIFFFPLHPAFNFATTRPYSIINKERDPTPCKLPLPNKKVWKD